jgi:CHASE3 domain sensor protein
MEDRLKINTLENQMEEVNKKLDSQDKKIDELSDKIDKGFKDVQFEMGKTYVRKSEYELDKQRTQEEVRRIQNIWEWAIRIVLGAVILALLGTILI